MYIFPCILQAAYDVQLFTVHFMEECMNEWVNSNYYPIYLLYVLKQS